MNILYIFGRFCRLPQMSFSMTRTGPQGTPGGESASKNNSNQSNSNWYLLSHARISGFSVCLRMFGLLFRGVLEPGR